MDLLTIALLYCSIQQGEYKLNTHGQTVTVTSVLSLKNLLLLSFRTPSPQKPWSFLYILLYTYSSLADVLQYTLLLSFASLPFMHPSLFYCSDCDELSHLKCFLSLCFPGGFQSPSIILFPHHQHHHPPLNPLFLCTHLHDPLPYCSCSLYVSPPVLCPFFSPSLDLCLDSFLLFWKHHSNHNHALRTLHHLHPHPTVNR